MTDDVYDALKKTTASGISRPRRIQSRDNLSRVTSITLPDPDSGGPQAPPVIQLGYDPRDNLIKKVDALGRVTQFLFDINDRPIGSVDALGGVTADVYSAAGEATLSVDAMARQTARVFDGLSRNTSVTLPDPDGPAAQAAPVHTFAFDPAGNTTSWTDGRGNTTDQVFDGLYRLTSVTAPDPDAGGPASRPVTTYTYNAVGERLTRTDALSRVTTSAYDGLGRISSITLQDPDNGGPLTSPVISYVHDGLSRLTSLVMPDPDGAGGQAAPTVTYVHDGLSRLVQVQESDPDAGGPLAAPVTSYTFDVASQLTRVVDPLSRDTVYTRDNLGRVTGVTNELNQTTTSEFDGANNVVKRTDAQGFSVASTFDPLDRLVKNRDPRDGVTQFGHDPVGNTTVLVDAALNTNLFEHDRLDRRTADVNQLGGRRTWAYDAANNITKAVDRNGRIREFTHDTLNRPTQEQWKNGETVVRTITTAFDAADQLTSASDVDGTYAFTRDLLGRVTSVDNNGTSGVPRVILTNSYDTLSRRTSLSASVAGTADFLNTFSYDTLSRMTRVDQTGQSGGNTVAAKRVDFEYNAINQFTKVARYKDTAGGAANEVATSTFAYDTLARLTGLDHKIGTMTIAGYTWQFDVLNRVTQFVSPDGTTTYGYDATGQLTLADHTYQADGTYVHDLNGNRANPGHQTGDNNRLLSDGTFTYTHDAEGNRLTRQRISSGPADDYLVEYAWDHRNRLTAVTFKNNSGTVTKTVAYAYDVFDRRILKSVDADGPGAGAAVVSRYVYDTPREDGLDNIVLVFNGSGAITHRYLHGPAVDQILADEAVGGTLLWALPDESGTVRDLVNNSGTVQNHLKFDAFGQVTAESNAAIDFLFGFTGRERDEETGLNYHRARYYDPAIGRWISEDPLGFAAGDTNLARYVSNNPTRYSDPTGTEEYDADNQYTGGVIWGADFEAGDTIINSEVGPITVTSNDLEQGNDPSVDCATYMLNQLGFQLAQTENGLHWAIMADGIDAYTLMWSGVLGDDLNYVVLNQTTYSGVHNNPTGNNPNQPFNNLVQFMITLYHEVNGHSQDEATHDTPQEEAAFNAQYETPILNAANAAIANGTFQQMYDAWKSAFDAAQLQSVLDWQAAQATESGYGAYDAFGPPW